MALALALPAGLLIRSRSKPVWVAAAVLTVLAAVAGLTLVALTGHSGATAVWGS